MNQPQTKPSIFQNFLIGSSAGLFATCCVQPGQVLKTRLQISSEARSRNFSILKAIKDLYGQGGGIRAFYTGQEALLRTAVYTTLRMGIFYSLSDTLKAQKGGSQVILTPLEKAGCAFIAGSVGSFLGTPFDVSLVRMQNDLVLPKHMRRNYRNVFNAVATIGAQQGIRGLWKGAQATVTRAIAVNVASLVSFEEAKQRLARRFGEGKNTSFMAAAISGFFVCLVSMPFDNVKIKLQKQSSASALRYAGVIDCFKQTATRQGIRGFYSGFLPYYARLAPHTMILLFLTDFLKRALGF